MKITLLTTLFTLLSISVFSQAEDLLLIQTQSYKAISKGNLIEETNLVVDSKNGFLKKLSYTYAEDSDEMDIGMHKILINYSNVKRSISSASVFDISRYVTPTISGYSATVKYAGFKIQVITKSERI